MASRLPWKLVDVRVDGEVSRHWRRIKESIATLGVGVVLWESSVVFMSEDPGHAAGRERKRKNSWKFSPIAFLLLENVEIIKDCPCYYSNSGVC